MRIVGNRHEVKLSERASGELLRAACEFNEALQNAFPFGKFIAIKRGVYRFRSQNEANRHQEQCLTDTMVAIDRIRSCHG